MRRLFQRISEWMMYPRKAERDAVRRSERFLRAFLEGDSEYVTAEMARVNGADFFALAAQQHALTDAIVRQQEHGDA